MDEINAFERIVGALLQTPEFKLVLIIMLVWVVSPIAMTWLTRRKGDNTIVPSLVNLMGETNKKIATNVELSRQAIEHGNQVMAQVVEAVSGFNQRAELHFQETHEYLKPISDGMATALLNDTANSTIQAEIRNRLDALEGQMTEAIDAVMVQFSVHEDRAQGRTAKINTTIETMFGDVLAELHAIRECLAAEPRPLE